MRYNPHLQTRGGLNLKQQVRRLLKWYNLFSYLNGPVALMAVVIRYHQHLCYYPGALLNIW